MGLIQMVKDSRENRYYKALSDKIASLDEANIPELTSLRKNWETIKATIGNEKAKIDRKEELYIRNLRKQQRLKDKIAINKIKMSQLRKTPILSRIFLNVAQLWGNPKALEYASYKRSIEEAKKSMTTLRGESAFLLADINEIALQNEQNKIKLKEIEQAIIGKYNTIKHDLKDIALFEKNKQMLVNKLSKETMKELQDIIQAMKEGKELPDGVDKKQVMALMKKVIAQKDSKDNKDNQQDQQQDIATANRKDQSFKDGIKDWPAKAFSKYHIDRNKLANALRASSIKDPVKFLCALGKMSIGKSHENGVSDRVLLDKGLQILQAAINGDNVVGIRDARAYKIALTLVNSAGDLRMHSDMQQDTQAKDVAR